MIYRWFLFIANLLAIILSAGWLIRLLIRFISGSQNFQEIRFTLLAAIIILILSLVAYPIRKSLFPLPGIDYK
ncbi:MAG: hypothetical protein JXR31_17100 [Prolixibacteraceae bacterium]|nr:hypothetical protein [Prolixibacteraceae bacterium]